MKSRLARVAAAASAIGIVLIGCAAVPPAADPASDAPELRVSRKASGEVAGTYADAVAKWRTAEEINEWIGAQFEYDRDRAMQLSETQRARGATVAIHAPDAFFASPTGVCVDLARFAVETLRLVDPKSRPVYVMIEFDPFYLSGNALRRHWVAGYERDGMRYFFADSKRPGHIAGPYASTQAFIDDYAGYRGRRIIAFSERDSYQRTLRKPAARQARSERPS